MVKKSIIISVLCFAVFTAGVFSSAKAAIFNFSGSINFQCANTTACQEIINNATTAVRESGGKVVLATHNGDAK
jgi:hypothetical protein